MRTFILAATVIAGVLCVIFPTRPAAAQCCGEPTAAAGLVVSAIGASSAAVTGAISTNTLLQLTATKLLLEMHAAELGGKITAMGGVHAAIADSVNTTNFTMRLEDDRLRAMEAHQFSATACQAVSGRRTSTRVVTSLQSSAIGASIAGAAGVQHGQGTTPAGLPGVSERFNDHVTNYCVPGDPVCGNQPGARPGRDRAPAASLLAPRTLATAADRKAADDVIANLVQPVPPPPLPAQFVAGTTEGKRAFVERGKAETRLALARDALNGLKQRREPKVAPAWYSSVGQEIGLSAPSEGVSLADQEWMLNVGRFQTASYLSSIEKLKPNKLALEGVMLDIQSLNQQWRTNELLEQVVALLATMVAAPASDQLEKLAANPSIVGASTPTVGQ